MNNNRIQQASEEISRAMTDLLTIEILYEMASSAIATDKIDNVDAADAIAKITELLRNETARISVALDKLSDAEHTAA